MVVAGLEQHGLRTSIEVYGVFKVNNEDFITVLRGLPIKLNLGEPSVNDIEAVHRLPAREGRIPPILVRFKERRVWYLWINKKSHLDRNIFLLMKTRH